jgi:hypothetical protein
VSRHARRHPPTFAFVSDLDRALAADLKRVGCRCRPDLEVRRDAICPGVGFLEIKHDAWCPAIHDPADN